MLPEGWRRDTPSKCIKLFGGAAFSSDDAQIAGVRWLKIANVGVGKIKWEDESFLPIDFAEEHSRYVLRTPDIVVALTRPTINNKLKIARFSEADGVALLNQRVAKIVCTKDTDDEYIYQLFRTDEVAYRINASLLGTDPPNLSVKVLDDFLINIPPLPEQKKIAGILSTWDKAIETVEKLIENSQQKKKALMQQLLTGKQRFPEFDGEWKEIRLDELLKGKKRKGKIVPTNEERVGTPYIGSTSFEGEFGIYTDSEEAVLCKPEDILVLWDGENAGKVATGLSGAVSSTVVRYKVDSSKASNQFIAYCLLKDNYKVRAIREGSGIPHMPGDFEHWYNLTVPSVEEQEKIASVILGIDAEIGSLNRHREALQTEKKGLMQQLLTGKKRVQVN